MSQLMLRPHYARSGELVGFSFGDILKPIKKVAKVTVAPIVTAHVEAAKLAGKVKPLVKVAKVAAPVVNTAIKIGTSKELKAAAAGLAVIAPPAGATLATGIAAAHAAKGIAAGLKSTSPAVRAVATNVVKLAAAASKGGNKSATKGLAMVANAARLAKVDPKARAEAAATAARAAAKAKAPPKPKAPSSGKRLVGSLVTLVNGQPRIIRGNFVQA